MPDRATVERPERRPSSSGTARANDAFMLEERRRESAETIARLNAGDESAYAELWETHHDRLCAVAHRILRDRHDAEDAVQDAFTSLIRNLGSFRGEATIGTWLHVVVRNAARMRLRKRRRTPLHLTHEGLSDRVAEPGPEFCPVARLASSGCVARVRRHIEALAPLHREVIHLRALEQLDTEETSHRLKISRIAVRSAEERWR